MKLGRILYKKREKISGFKHYKDLDTLPIYNWYNIHTKNDFKWLLILDDYSKEYKFSKEQQFKLQVLYYELLFTFEKLELEILQLKRDYQVKLLKLVGEIAEHGTDLIKLKKAFDIIPALIIDDNPNIDWLFKVDFTNTPDQRSYLTEIAIGIHKYNAKRKGKKRSKVQTLNEKIVTIERVIGVKINPRNCPVNLFKEYEKQTIERINEQNKLIQ